MKIILPLVVLTLWLAGIAGWVVNIIEVFHANFTVLTGELILRVIGIFVPPLGAIMGLFV